jgi:hypothetical protein
VALGRSHHIGCLAALAKAATDRGLFVLLASSGPHTFAVAPHGGREPLFSPNPFAIGFPAGKTPVPVDICASLTAVSMTREKAAACAQFAHPWLLDHQGRPTTDPTVMESAENRGNLLLLGGQEAGHKGFGLELMVEALTQGLAGFGCRDTPTSWGAMSTSSASTPPPSPAPRRSPHRPDSSPSSAALMPRSTLRHQCACPASTPAATWNWPWHMECHSRRPPSATLDACARKLEVDADCLA